MEEGKYGKGDFILRLAGVWGYNFKLGGKLCFGVDTESRLGTVEGMCHGIIWDSTIIHWK